MSIGQVNSGMIPWGYSLQPQTVTGQSNKVRIQDRLISLVKAGAFFAVKYDPTTGQAISIDTDTDPQIQPATAIANETGTSFVSDPRMGRRHSQRKKTWMFSVIAEWNQEVSIEFFENSLQDEIITLPIDQTNNLPVTFIRLLSSSIQHPVTQGSAKGTKVKFAFQADLGRI